MRAEYEGRPADERHAGEEEQRGGQLGRVEAVPEHGGGEEDGDHGAGEDDAQRVRHRHQREARGGADQHEPRGQAYITISVYGPGHLSLTLQYDGGLLARWPGQQVLPPAERCIVTTILPSADPHLQQHTAV